MDNTKAQIQTLEMCLTTPTKNKRAWVAGMRQASRGLWAGVFTTEQWNQMIFNTINKGLNAAWNRGFMEFGITPTEQDATERQRIFNVIMEQSGLMNGLMMFIIANSKENKGKLKVILRRVALWERRYDQVQSEARARAGANRKMEWVLGVAEHCPSCVKLSGRVKRGRWWVANGILPAVPAADYLECRGYKCKCKLMPTNKPATRGRMPRLP